MEKNVSREIYEYGKILKEKPMLAEILKEFVTLTPEQKQKVIDKVLELRASK